VKDSGYYQNGLKQGLWLHRDTAKKIIYKGSYINGTKVKEWKFYDLSGKLQEILFYTQKGELKWRKRFQKGRTG
jgi:antitoxin component YwqK of YwqJK toxin-antitoxin module